MSDTILSRLGRMCGDRVLVCRLGIGKEAGEGMRCIKDENGKPLLYLSDNAADGFQTSHKFDRLTRVVSSEFQFCELVDVGDGCQIFKKEQARAYCGVGGHGITTIAHELCPGQECLEDFSPYWFIHERHLIPVVVEKDGLYPLKDWIVVSLKREKCNEDGSIILNTYYESPTTFGTVLHIGAEVKEKLSTGDRVVIQNNQRVYQFGERWLSCLPLCDVVAVVE